MKTILIDAIVAVTIYSLGCGYFAFKIAEQKKYNPLTWFFLGFFFNIAAVIAIGVFEINPNPEPTYSEED